MLYKEVLKKTTEIYLVDAMRDLLTVILFDDPETCMVQVSGRVNCPIRWRVH
jgi:hypothetical protein